ncbi:hypothetical protein XELAEV_18015285mg [Xenopus laevis]|uniref:Uncharacterized protein n=1 Tax=Xenopus laevis TaxID=8355 RepID=A0A974DHQ4_XENLA|nr:hypothetical protein XELAEV_18015285mg [Xenopus laevis]
MSSYKLSETAIALRYRGLKFFPNYENEFANWEITFLKYIRKFRLKMHFWATPKPSTFIPSIYNSYISTFEYVVLNQVTMIWNQSHNRQNKHNLSTKEKAEFNTLENNVSITIKPENKGERGYCYGYTIH